MYIEITSEKRQVVIFNDQNKIWYFLKAGIVRQYPHINNNYRYHKSCLACQANFNLSSNQQIRCHACWL